MKHILLFIISGLLLSLNATSQTLVASTPAKLQLYGSTTSNEEFIVSSESLNINYGTKVAQGDLKTSTLTSNNPDIVRLISSIKAESISFETVIPEGEYTFGSSMNERFTTEAVLKVGDYSSRFLMNFDISNKKTNTSNLFQVVCTGKLSLSENFGLTDAQGLKDSVSFQFTQNVRTIKK